MAQSKLDYKKAYKELYQPKGVPSLVRVPVLPFFQIDGHGAPESACYQSAMQALYALTFTIKMSKMSGRQPDGYFEYVVPPLEGLWGNLTCRDDWRWTSMIRQPEFVTEEVARWAMEECARKKPQVDLTGARFSLWEEGLCVQMLHVGPYSEEQRSFAEMDAFTLENGLRRTQPDTHHELYLSDPRRTAPERLKTVLRYAVEPL